MERLTLSCSNEHIVGIYERRGFTSIDLVWYEPSHSGSLTFKW